ncbi:MAG: hypothetical protein GYA23_12735 [Methanomicrobiales archaeon]|nr:hypothetical protein [Methanomicrobiales archaeon]
MDIIVDSVKKLEKLLEHSGCSDGGVRLDVDPYVVNCRFEKGACMTADFGKKQGIFTTFDPLRCLTKISFMFGAPLDTPPARGAACAITNVAAGFFCLSRTLHPCPAASHASCGKNLGEELAGRQVFAVGTIQGLESIHGITVTPDPSGADIILIGCEGLIDPVAGEIIGRYAKTKRILFLGPSTAGIARLNEMEHLCPHGLS